MKVSLKEAFLSQNVYVDGMMRQRIQASVDKPLVWNQELAVVEYGNECFPIGIFAKLVTVPQLVAAPVAAMAAEQLEPTAVTKRHTKGKPKRSD